MLIHDWEGTYQKYFIGAGERPSLEEFLAHKMIMGLHQLDLDALFLWLQKHPEARIVTDVKDGNLQDNRSFSLGQCEFREFQMQLKSSDGGDPPSCLLKLKGEACEFADECCSGKCKGQSGGKTCK